MILRNAVRTPDGTLLESHHTFDYKGHTDANGEYYMVDGGIRYLRYSEPSSAPATCLYLSTDDTHEEIREGFSWGTYGINRDEALKYVLLKDMDTSHINAIITTHPHIAAELRKVFRDELIYRGNK